MRRFGACVSSMLAVLTLIGVSGCGSTTDVIGTRPITLSPIACKSRLGKSAFASIGITETEIEQKLEFALNVLFDPASGSSIYTLDTELNEGYIKDTLHKDIRTEGSALGMLFAVQMNKQDIFDQLLNYAKAKMRIPSGQPLAGYYGSYCDRTELIDIPCTDPYGLQQFAVALLLADHRWGANRPDYAEEAKAILRLLSRRGKPNDVSDIGSSFDEEMKLPYDDPNNGNQQFVRTSVVMPGYYDLFAQVTSDSFFTEAAHASRAFIARASDTTTGLFPLAAEFSGKPIAGKEFFGAEAYRVHLNLAIDAFWGSATSEEVILRGERLERLLKFFAGARTNADGSPAYGKTFSLAGNELDTLHVDELVIANAVAASISSHKNREQFIRAAWNLSVPIWQDRYYAALFYLIGNLLLSGRFSMCPGTSSAF